MKKYLEIENLKKNNIIYGEENQGKNKFYFLFFLLYIFTSWNFFLSPSQTEKQIPQKGDNFFRFSKFSLQSLVTFW